MDRTNKLGVGIALIAIIAIITTASVSLPTVYAKKHHHLTDTQKEDSTASDANGNECTAGPAHDECLPMDLSKEGKGWIPSHPVLCEPNPDDKDADCPGSGF